jgi:hypothetical protein
VGQDLEQARSGHDHRVLVMAFSVQARPGVLSTTLSLRFEC